MVAGRKGSRRDATTATTETEMMVVQNPVERRGSPVEGTLLDVVKSVVIDEAGLKVDGILKVLIDDRETVDTSPGAG